MYYMSELYSIYSRLYEEFDQNNVVNNPNFMDVLVLGTLPYILESNPHHFYSFRRLQNQMRIRIACWL